MEASKVLKKEIIIELVALVLFSTACVFAMVSLKGKEAGDIASYDDVVTILDEKKFKGIDVSSDGKALNGDGVTYTITNNQSKVVSYQIVIYPNIHDEEVLKQVRIALDDIYISDLNQLERNQGGYVLGMKALNPGYTKIHSIKYWYKLDTSEEISRDNVKFKYKIELL